MIIRCFDSETSGLTPAEGDLIEFGYADVILPARTIEAPVSWLCGTDKPITPENRAVHHINPAMLVGRDKFDPPTVNDTAKADGVTCWSAHNLAFDEKFFPPELPAFCTYKAALRAWPDAPSHGLSVLRYWLEENGRLAGFNYAHASTHRAGPDAYVCAWLVRCLLEDGHTGKTLLQWSKEPPLFPRCPIGKYKNQTWSDCDTGWLQWLAFKSDMDENLKHNARLELDRRT